MERRTSCLQSNVDFLQKTITKLALDNQRRIDAANRQIDGLKAAVASLEKLVEEMVDEGVQFDDAVHEFEKRFISRVLGQFDGSLTKTADALGIHRNTLTRKMGEYKIKRRAG